jgi:hypothetical protein
VEVAQRLEEPVGFRPISDYCEQPVTSPVCCRDRYSSFTACEDYSIQYNRHLMHKPDIWNVSFKEQSVKYLVMGNFMSYNHICNYWQKPSAFPWVVKASAVIPREPQISRVVKPHSEIMSEAMKF